jgi:tetratricopeptide (TPR) repeat protein
VATNRDKLIAGAQKLVEKGQFEKAIKEYLKVVQTDDKDVRIWLKIGDLYAKLAKKTEAAEVYQKVAQFYSDQGFYLKSVAVYKQILKIEPRLVEVNQRLAELYKQLGLLSDAMMQYETVAAFFHREGKTREALSALKQIVELDPETVANRIKLAELYSKEAMPREAIEEFSRAAEQLRQAGRADDFMKVAERLLFHSPDNRPISKELAKLYIEKGDPRRALPKLQVCFKADARDTEVLALLAQAFEALDQRQKAVSVLKELARVHSENHNTRERDEIFAKILVLAPGDPDAEAAIGSRRRVPTPLRIEGSGEKQLGSPWEARPPSLTSAEPTFVEEFDEVGPTSGTITRVAGTPPPVSSLLEGGESPAHDEQVARILNETDVYIKYKLYAKAIEHVQRVFERHPDHLDAREKLKGLYLTIGKHEEAVVELWALAAQAEPGRQRRYLREILEIDPHNKRAREQLGLPMDAPVDEIVRHGGASEPPEEIEEIPSAEFDIADPSGVSSPDLVELGGEFDDMPNTIAEPEDDLIPVVVEPLRDSSEIVTNAAIEGLGGSSARADPLEHSRFSLEESEPPVPMAAHDSEVIAVVDGAAALLSAEDGSRTRFDGTQHKFDEAFAGSVVEEVDESDLPGVPASAQLPESGAEASQTRPAAPAAETSLEDDLDEADFFVQQNLFDEARAILKTLHQRMPAHPLVAAKLRDLDAMERAANGGGADDASAEVAVDEHASADLAAELPEELPGSSDANEEDAGDQQVYELTRRGVVEKGVTAEDFETHYDLGIAYKEMGLLDDAIVEFKLVMKDPTREVQCHLMIGLCCLEKGLQTDAIGHFKKGLYVDGITERESLSLYYELGSAYERLGDPREALYYFEKVVKRDAHFRNVERRIEALRGGGGQGAALAQPAKTEDVDGAFDALLGKDAS